MSESYTIKINNSSANADNSKDISSSEVTITNDELAGSNDKGLVMMGKVVIINSKDRWVQKTFVKWS